MNILIDFTQNQYVKAAQLYEMESISQINFIIPFMMFLQTSFTPLLQYISFLNENSLINAKVKSIISQQEKKQLQKYNKVLVRGTFDRLHIGHQLLLLNAIYSTKQELIIQIKGDELLKNKQLKQLIQPFEFRKAAIQSFVQNIKHQIKINVVQIQQLYGNAPNSKSIQAIVVSQESIFSSKHINKIRKQNGLKKVFIIITPVITSNNKTKQLRIENKISSRSIRQTILSKNNFTVNQYLNYKNIWDYLVKQINTLCNIKDPDLVKAYKWFQKVIKYHSVSTNNTNRQILQRITNFSRSQHQSLSQITNNLKLFLKGVRTQKQLQLKGVCKQFLQTMFKKKSKICKKIKKMILKQIQQKQNVKEERKKKHNQNNQKSKIIQQKNKQKNETRALNSKNNTIEEVNQTKNGTLKQFLNSSQNNVSIIQIKQNQQIKKNEL